MKEQLESFKVISYDDIGKEISVEIQTTERTYKETWGFDLIHDSKGHIQTIYKQDLKSWCDVRNISTVFYDMGGYKSERKLYEGLEDIRNGKI